MRTEPPAWVRELEMAVPVYPQILLTGNVRDQHLLPGKDGSPVRLDIQGVIRQVCRDHGFGALAVHDLLSQRLIAQRFRPDAEFPNLLGELVAEDEATPPEPLSTIARIRQILVELVRHRGPAIGMVFPYAASVGGDPNDPEGRGLFMLIEALGHVARPVPERLGKGGGSITPYNTVFWVAERPEQLSADFPVGSRRLRVIAVPDPPLDQRIAAAQQVVHQLTGRLPAEQDEKLLAAASALASLTHGMQNVETYAIGRLARQRGLPPERLDDAARLYRVGVVDNPWAEASLRKKIAGGENYLNKRVVGQEEAVGRTIDIFTRSATGLTGAQTGSSPNRPRGVLFLSGPTGVGKTELAKGIATLVLGDDARPIRFDMSEFAADHARHRLIGAPPGYVGHDAGGELTNAVRANPMSVLLFDEIDKAHPGLFDLFLQILEDGRLTDGHGATVFFTEAVLIFTSNLGVATEVDGVARDLSFRNDPAEVRTALRKAFEVFFDKVLRRPELRNRFGDNFIAMDFIQPESVPLILDRSIASVAARVLDLHKARLEIGDDAYDTLRVASVNQLDHGGRGILNVVESALVNPLSRLLFHEPAEPGETITVDDVVRDGERWKLEATRCPA